MHTVTLPSERAEFAGFEAFYAAEIAPYLAAKEGARRGAVVNFFILTGALGLLGVAMLLFGPFGETNFQVAAMIGFGAAGVGLWLLNRTRDDIAHGLLQRTAGRLGCEYRARPGRPAYYDAFRALRLLPGHDIEVWEDEVSGRRADCAFTFCESHLKKETRGKNRSVRTVFHGQLLVLTYPKRFLGKTVVGRDRGAMNPLMRPGKEFARVALVSAEFEKAFEAWSTDQVEARELLDPVVLERFQELERLFGGKKLRAAFADGQVLIAIETGDRLNMGSMFKTLEDPARVETILKEFDVVFDLIDVLVKRIDRPLAGAFSVAAARGA